MLGYKIAYGKRGEYIEHYSTKELMHCLGRIEKIVTFIVERTKAPGME